ncbi:MAG: ABC transporter related [Methanomicrobiales archaeon 53_19]|jgi:ABC-type lipoprotein export system ATPase subunit|uniref:ATP-binding cassette domain-containing protein n=1 Tax=Methanocalculus sp. TaxID=2004547 RepID=UPI000747E976|nr:MAG: ABC transporter related [Methanomicrobiales archaeon 53_19]
MIETIRFRDVSKIYSLKSGDVTALDHVSLSIEEGEFIAIMDSSGSGKSTLLNMMGCLDTPTYGEVFINGQNIGELSDDDLTILRRRHLVSSSSSSFLFRFSRQSRTSDSHSSLMAAQMSAQIGA